MNLVWQKQPEDCSLCGQTAVAVIVGCSLDEAIRAVGHKHGTTTRDLVRALRLFGVSCEDRCRPMPGRVAPNLGLAQVHTPERSGWHWVVVHAGRIYDGIWGL